MKYKVNLTFPTLIVIDGKEYLLYGGTEVELPDSEIVETYKGLGYLEPVAVETKKTKKEEGNAS